MRNRIHRLLLLLPPALLTGTAIFAQSNTAEPFMRSNGKIYVVLAICVTILLGLLLYVASIDRKIGRIEKGDPPL